MAIISVALGANIASTISGAAGNSTFNFAAGTYYGQTFAPRAGDTYVGHANGTTISGGWKITNWAQSGAVWKATTGAFDSGGVSLGSGQVAFSNITDWYGAKTTGTSFNGTTVTIGATTFGAVGTQGGAATVYATGVPQGTRIIGGGGSSWTLSANVGTLGARNMQISRGGAGADAPDNQWGNRLFYYNADLVVDGALYIRISKQNAGSLTTNQWYWDEADQSVNVSTNLTGHNVEISAIFACCTSGGGANCLFNNLTFQSYCGGQYWDSPIEGLQANYLNCTFQFNHCTGHNAPASGSGFWMQGCKFLYNGNCGLTANSSYFYIVNSEIAFNGVAGGWNGAAAGAKSIGVNGATHQWWIGNYVHDNYSAGLWWDIGAQQIYILNNRIENNLWYNGAARGGPSTNYSANGIHYEISSNAIIAHNYISGNDGAAVYQSDSGIGVEIRNNVMLARQGNVGLGYSTNTGGCVLAWNSNRDDGGTNVPGTFNVNVHDNVFFHINDTGLTGIQIGGTATSGSSTWTNNTYFIGKNPVAAQNNLEFDARNPANQFGGITNWMGALAAGFETGPNSSLLPWPGTNVADPALSFDSAMALIRDGQAVGSITPRILRQALFSMVWPAGTGYAL